MTIKNGKPQKKSIGENNKEKRWDEQPMGELEIVLWNIPTNIPPPPCYVTPYASGRHVLKHFFWYRLPIFVCLHAIPLKDTTFNPIRTQQQPQKIFANHETFKNEKTSKAWKPWLTDIWSDRNCSKPTIRIMCKCIEENNNNTHAHTQIGKKTQKRITSRSHTSGRVLQQNTYVFVQIKNKKKKKTNDMFMTASYEHLGFTPLMDMNNLQLQLFWQMWKWMKSPKRRKGAFESHTKGFSIGEPGRSSIGKPVRSSIGRSEWSYIGRLGGLL